MLGDNDLEDIQHLGQAYQRLAGELGKVIVGQHDVVEQLLVAMFARGHCLLVGVPGLAKTLQLLPVGWPLSIVCSHMGDNQPHGGNFGVAVLNSVGSHSPDVVASEYCHTGDGDRKQHLAKAESHGYQTFVP